MTCAPTRVLSACALALALSGCGAQDSVARTLHSVSKLARADSMGVVPVNVQQISTSEPNLVESSALVASGSQAGILFTINDSGNTPELFALDTSGAARGRWSIRDASNRDWEAAASGPCTGNTIPDSSALARPCLYIGDVGDNTARRATVSIYQVTEPVVGITGVIAELPARVLRLRYPDGAHDVEAMYVGPNGTVYLITKRVLKTASGQLRPALVFSVPSSAWMRPDTIVAELSDSLPIVPGSAQQRQITDAALSLDAHHLAVRTYGQVYVFATDAQTGRVLHDVPPAVCNIMQIESRYGEGVTWISGRAELMLSHEGRNAPLHRITCPLPTR